MKQLASRAAPSDRGDLESEIWLHLLQAAKRFDGRDVNLTSFTKKSLKHRVGRFLDRESRRGVKVPENLRATTPRPGMCSTDDFPLKAHSPPETDEDFWLKVESALPGHEWRVVKYRYRDGLDLKEIARRVCRRRAQIKRWLRAAIRKLRRYFRDERKRTT